MKGGEDVSIDDYRRIFADNLKYFLDLNDMTQAELARALGVSETAIHSWITAEKSPRMNNVDKMVDIFQIERSDLIVAREEGRHYLDIETRSMADEILKNKELRLLFDAAQDVSADDLHSVSEILKALKKKEIGDDG